MPEAATDYGAMMEKQRSAWAEAGRGTYGVVYWTLTVLLTLATVASWIWGGDAVRFAVSTTAIVFVFVSGAVQHRRMNHIARARENREREEDAP